MKIITVVVVFSFLMVIHELGHFLTARRLGIRAYELSLGIGPKLFGVLKNGTQYNLRLIPFGAFVRFGDEEDEFFAEPDNFMNQPPIDRIKVIIMGPVVNIVAALLIMIGVVYYMGFPVNEVGSVMDGLPAQQAGIEAGDRVVGLNGAEVTNWEDFISTLAAVEDKNHVELTLQTADGEEKEVVLAMQEYEGRYLLGIMPARERNFLMSIRYGATATLTQSTMMIDSLKQLFIGQADIDEFSGPVGIMAVVGEATDHGFVDLMSLVSLLSLNLGIVNLVPIPGLDGSKILFYGYEAIVKKPINRTAEERITMAGMMLILGFALFLTYQDVLKLFFPENKK